MARTRDHLGSVSSLFKRRLDYAPTEQRPAEEKAADRVVARDIQRTAAISREKRAAKNFEDITEQDWPDGDLDKDGETPEKPSSSVEPTHVEVPERPPVRRRLTTKTDVTRKDRITQCKGH